MRTSSSVDTLTTAARTRSTAATTGVRRASGCEGTGCGSSSASAAGAWSAKTRTAARRTALLVVVGLFELALDLEGLVFKVGQLLQVLLVLLLVDLALADVALD